MQCNDSKFAAKLWQTNNKKIKFLVTMQRSVRTVIVSEEPVAIFSINSDAICQKLAVNSNALQTPNLLAAIFILAVSLRYTYGALLQNIFLL